MMKDAVVRISADDVVGFGCAVVEDHRESSSSFKTLRPGQRYFELKDGRRFEQIGEVLMRSDEGGDIYCVPAIEKSTGNFVNVECRVGRDVEGQGTERQREVS